MSESATSPLPRVRLSTGELERLGAVFDRCRSDDLTARVYLFGSRSDPLAHGGDLDLLVVSEAVAERSYHTRQTLRLAIWEALGEQKVDILISAGPAEPDEPALTWPACLEGVQLWPCPTGWKPSNG